MALVYGVQACVGTVLWRVYSVLWRVCTVCRRWVYVWCTLCMCRVVYVWCTLCIRCVYRSMT